MAGRRKRAVEEIDLFAVKEFSPKQAELIEWYRAQRALRLAGQPHQTRLAVVWGRRCGKSDGVSALFCEVLGDLLCDAADAIARGDARPWRGIGKRSTEARIAKPHYLAFVAAPSGRDLRDIAGYMLNVFSDQAECFLHRDPKMRFGSANGLSMYLTLDGAAVRVDFIPTKQTSAMVGRGPAAVLMTECGFIPSEHWDRLSPGFYDHNAWVFIEGTPKQDPSHWFTREAVSGLPDGDPEANRDIARRNPLVHTSRANTIDHAFLPRVREMAKFDEQYRGRKWSDLWIYASLKAQADTVFDEFDPVRGVVDVELGGKIKIHRTIGDHTDTVVLPYPQHVEGYIDWGFDAPGALTVCYVWTARPRPLDASDPRALVLVVYDYMDDEERLHHGEEGWIGLFKKARASYGIRRFYADPSAPKRLEAAKRQGVYISKADNEDKEGRIVLLNAMLHIGPAGWPALLIASNCHKTVNALASVGWQKTREGLPTDKPQKYNLHLPDTLAYMSARWGRGFAIESVRRTAASEERQIAMQQPGEPKPVAGASHVVSGEVT